MIYKYVQQEMKMEPNDYSFISSNKGQMYDEDSHRALRRNNTFLTEWKCVVTLVIIATKGCRYKYVVIILFKAEKINLIKQNFYNY